MSEVISLYEYRVSIGKPLGRVIYSTCPMTGGVSLVVRMPARFGFPRHSQAFSPTDARAATAWAEAAWRNISKFDVEALYVHRDGPGRLWHVFREDMLDLRMPLAGFADPDDAYDYVCALSGSDLNVVVERVLDGGRRA